jgi:membrane protease YdiL (CAAX protease family)
MLKKFFQFLKKPIEGSWKLSFSKRLSYFFGLFVLNACFTFAMMVVLSGLEKNGYAEINQQGLNFFLNNMPLWLLGLLAIVLIPLLEEIIFRLPQRFKYNPSKYALWLFYKLKDDGVNSKQRAKQIWKHIFGPYLYISTILFSLVHLTNFELGEMPLYVFPILVLPYFLAGLIISFLRIVFNFWTGFLFHAIHNAFFLFLSLVVLHQPVEKYAYTSKDYKLKIYRSGSVFYDKYRSYYGCETDMCQTIDSLNLSKVPLKESLSNI